MDYLDADVAYLLGLIAARGQVMRSNGGYKLVLQFPHSYIQTDSMNERHQLIASLTTIQNRIGGLTKDLPSINPGASSTDITYEEPRYTLLFRDLKMLMGKATGFENFEIPKYLYDESDDVKREFVRGFGDVAGNIRKSNAFFGGRNRVYLDILNVNWKLPTQLCHLLQDSLRAPVQTITWGHPNLRNSPNEKWTKREHQVKVFANEYLKIGFYIEHKQKELIKLAGKKKMKGASFCDSKDTPMKRGQKHPDEKHADLPKELRGKHFDSYRHICREIGCARWQEFRKKQKRIIP